jgi:hypothetical protein
MEEQAVPPQVIRQIADLRMQVAALETTTKNASLPEMLKQTRRTIFWSALLVALALVISSMVRVCSDSKAKAFEERIQQLERASKKP